MDRNTSEIFLLVFCGILLYTCSIGAFDIDIILCKKQKISKSCEIACVNDNDRNVFVTFWHKDEFGDLREICSTSEFVDGRHCASDAYTITKWNSSITVMRIHSLQYYDYGHWYCKDKFAQSEEKLMDPYYLNKENIHTTFRISSNKEIPHNMVEVTPLGLLDVYKNMSDIIGVWGFDMEIQIGIRCAYPKPSLKIEIQTERKSCILCDDLWTVQYVESCDVPGQIGSYNYTCNVLKNPYVWNSCFFMMQRIWIEVFQNGLKVDKKMYAKKISIEDTDVSLKLQTHDQLGKLLYFTTLLFVTLYALHVKIFKKYCMDNHDVRKEKDKEIEQKEDMDLETSKKSESMKTVRSDKIGYAEYDFRTWEKDLTRRQLKSNGRSERLH